MADRVTTLKTVSFKILDKWFVEYYLNDTLVRSRFDMVRLESLLTPVKKRIKKADYDGSIPIVSKIVFETGEIVLRKKNETGMDLLVADRGALIVSSINFHQGAVALNDIGVLACSTHYQTYAFNTAEVNPLYLVAVLRSDAFLRSVSGKKANGIKNESGYDFIKNLKIPLPPLSVQAELIERLGSGTAASAGAAAEADAVRSESVANLLKAVSDGVRPSEQLAEAGALLETVPFSATERWEVAYLLRGSKINDILGSYKYPAVPFGDLVEESLFGLSLKASPIRKDGMIPMLRMSNVVDGDIDYTKLKYLPEISIGDARNQAKWRLCDGDFLVVRTNGSKDLVGKSAVFHSDIKCTYASYLIRYRLDEKTILPDFANILFATPLIRDQIAVMRRQGGGQYNLNNDEICAIRLPIPPIRKQKDIVQEHKADRSRERVLRLKSQNLRQDALAKFESTVFDT